MTRFIQEFNPNQLLLNVTMHSFQERSPLERQILQEQGDRLYVLRLQGLIFFGTVPQLVNWLRQRIVATQSAVRLIVLDFAQVSDIDASAVQSFIRIQQFVQG